MQQATIPISRRKMRSASASDPAGPDRRLGPSPAGQCSPQSDDLIRAARSITALMEELLADVESQEGQ
jgi:hypothetical protein